MKVRVNGKINLTLDVVGSFGEGYHKLDTVMASIGIFDIVEVNLSDKICVFMDTRECDESNTAFKVAKICHEQYSIPPLKIEITKGIPFCGGLGGSSADASAVLYCVQKMFGLAAKEIARVAEKVGSDVSFILQGGLCRAGGKGDKLENLPFKEYSLVVARGKAVTSTKEVFYKFDEIGTTSNHTQLFLSAFEDGNELTFIGNGLETSAINLCTDMEKVICMLARYSNHVCRSGSGACVFAVMENMSDANLVADKLKNSIPFVKACITLPYGIKEI